MATFAVIENDIVINTILADSLDIAEKVTGKTCVEYDESNIAGIGYQYKDNKFIDLNPPVPEEREIPTK